MYRYVHSSWVLHRTTRSDAAHRNEEVLVTTTGPHPPAPMIVVAHTTFQLGAPPHYEIRCRAPKRGSSGDYHRPSPARWPQRAARGAHAHRPGDRAGRTHDRGSHSPHDLRVRAVAGVAALPAVGIDRVDG